MDEWLAWASRSKLAPFVKLARTIRHYRDSIEATIEWKLTNGIAESNNAAIGRLRSAARGFQDPQAFITMVMLDRADLATELPWATPRMTHGTDSCPEPFQALRKLGSGVLSGLVLRCWEVQRDPATIGMTQDTQPAETSQVTEPVQHRRGLPAQNRVARAEGAVVVATDQAGLVRRCDGVGMRGAVGVRERAATALGQRTDEDLVRTHGDGWPRVTA